MRLVIMLGTATIALSFLISAISNLPSSGTAVAARFLERGNKLPAQSNNSDDLTVENFRRWVSDTSTASYAFVYAWKVIPLDFIFLACLALFLASGSSYLVSTISEPVWFQHAPIWIWWLVPLAYGLFDAGEDGLIVLFLNRPTSITDASLAILGWLRLAKIWTNVIATGQVFVLGALSYRS